MADFSQLDFTFQAPAPTRRIWTVRDLVAAIRTKVEREYTDIWVEGEISNFRPAESGHMYFTLKENAAQVRIVMFRSQAKLLRFRPENGMQVIARGRVTVYEDRGELQIQAECLEPKGAGALQVAFEQLKAKLQAEGLFEASRKKTIPSLPQRIGVVTSPRGAALYDILNILRRRHESVHVLIFPAQVQGEGASLEVSSGVRFFNRAKNVDVIVVARGGGSVEDLAAFNDEALARTIASSAIPVISAVGHETDFTICDFVADLRAPTPSAAAELVIRAKHDLVDRVNATHSRLARAMRYQLMMARQRLLARTQQGAFLRMAEQINRRQQRVDELVFRLANAEQRWLRWYRQRLDVASARLRHHDLRRQLANNRRVLEGQTGSLVSGMRARLFAVRSRLERLDAHFRALSPVAILERGYALVFDAEGKLVRNVAQVQEGDRITAQIATGKIRSRVEETENTPPEPSDHNASRG
jgi:exodeoxyribonuclease VII large subunit